MLVICPCCKNSFKLEIPDDQKSIIDSHLDHYILKACAKKFNTTLEAIKSKSRHTANKNARHCAAYLIYKYCGYSLKTVGNMLRRDHTTVIHARRRCFDSYATRSDLYTHLVALSTEIESILELKSEQPESKLKAVA
jgi:chromosomal replication initiation ATPase DnaA